MVAATRQRMYVFERAYVDYANRIRNYVRRVWSTCKNIWNWFWEGLGAKLYEYLLRLVVLGAAVAACVLYVRYEGDHGRGFSWGMVGVIAVIFVFTLIVLIGWKAPVHFLARLVSGTTAAGAGLILSGLALVVAIAVFSVYLVVLFVLTAASFIIFLPMRFLHWIWLTYRGISYRCPYDDCPSHQMARVPRHGMPVHVCTCGQAYDDLMPSFYGIFHHTCQSRNHKVKLPTMDLWGRKKLTRLCNVCKRELVFTDIGESAIKSIYVVGGPTVGKTHYLRQAVRQFKQHVANLPHAKVLIGSSRQEREYNNDLTTLDRGVVLEKTIEAKPEAFGVTFSIPKQLKALLYFYDTPGEHLLSMQEFGKKQAIAHVSGIVLVVDPFALPGLSSYVPSLSDQLKASPDPFKTVAGVVVNRVDLALELQSVEKCDQIRLAVVINKADALPVADLPYLKNLLPQAGSAWDDRASQSCRDALVKLGEGNSVRLLEQKFTQIRYFACSVLGRMPDGGNTAPFEATGVLPPLLWILNLDGDLSRKRK